MGLLDAIVAIGANLNWISPAYELAADTLTNGEIVAVDGMTPEQAKAILKRYNIPCNYASYTTDPDDLTLYVSVPGEYIEVAKAALW